MSLDANSLSNQCRTRLLLILGSDRPVESDFSEHIPVAIKTLAQRIAFDPGLYEKRLLFQKAFTFTITGESVDLDGVGVGINATEPLIIVRGRSFADVLVGTTRFRHVIDKPALDDLPMDDGESYYATRGTTVHLRGPSTVTGTLTIYGSYIPQLSNVPEELEPQLLDIMVELALGRATDLKARADSGTTKIAPAA